jgi:hypothetical protein
MQKFATEAWGDLGTMAVLRWSDFNKKYFDGELKPIPLVITNTLPFGRRLAFCSHDPKGPYHRTITLNVPTQHSSLLADNGTLLHEMIHQLLQQRGEPSAHASAGWRREIMRLNKLITGTEVWAGASITKRVVGDDGKRSKVVRINKPRDDGEPSLDQATIARWPHDGMGINLGRLGETCS